MAFFGLRTRPAAHTPATGDWAEWMRRATERMRAGAVGDAVPAFEQAAALRPDHLPTRLNLAAALFRAGDTGRALAIYDQVLAAHPDQAQAHHGRGLALGAAGDRDAALAAFRAATALAPDAWRSWASIADIATDETERQTAVSRVAITLESACRRSDTPALFVTCVGALIDAGRAADAIGFIDANASRFPDRTAVHDARARAWYRQGRFEEAFRHKLAALHSLDPEAIPAPGPNPFAPDAAVAALREVVAILEATGAQPFLAAGTLLGFHREGAPLAHDRDVDLGVVRSDGAPEIVAIVRQHPKLLLRRDARPGDRYVALAHKGIGVDVFVHDQRGDHLLCGFSGHDGDIQWRFTRFGLAHADYGGERWRIPDRPERYLEETYGPGWRRPDHGFASAISSPALFDVDPYARAYCTVARAKTAILLADTIKAAALLGQSPIRLPHWPPDARNAGMTRYAARAEKEVDETEA